MSLAAFAVHQRSDLAWTVMDTGTGLSALPARFELIGLSNTDAKHLAAILNFISNKLSPPDKTPIPVQ